MSNTLRFSSRNGGLYVGRSEESIAVCRSIADADAICQALNILCDAERVFEHTRRDSSARRDIYQEIERAVDYLGARLRRR